MLLSDSSGTVSSEAGLAAPVLTCVEMLCGAMGRVTEIPPSNLPAK